MTKNHNSNIFENKGVAEHLSDIANDAKLKKKNNVLLSSSGGIAVYADTLPIPTQDKDGNDGWLWEKLAIGTDKMNYYFYGEGNTTLTLNSVKSIYADIKIDYYDPLSIPFFHIYTKMTGSGDAGVWYKSKITYKLSTNEKIHIGEPIQLWCGIKPSNSIGFRSVECNVKTTTGTGLDTEDILTIAIGCDSIAPVGTRILTRNLGIEFVDGITTINQLITTESISGSVSIVSNKTNGEWLASGDIADNTYSDALDCSTFRNVRLFGEWTATHLSGLAIHGSQTISGTYYRIGNLDQNISQVGGVDKYFATATIQNVPNFIKLYNNMGSISTLELDYVGTTT